MMHITLAIALMCPAVTLIKHGRYVSYKQLSRYEQSVVQNNLNGCPGKYKDSPCLVRMEFYREGTGMPTASATCGAPISTDSK